MAGVILGVALLLPIRAGAVRTIATEVTIWPVTCATPMRTTTNWGMDHSAGIELWTHSVQNVRDTLAERPRAAMAAPINACEGQIWEGWASKVNAYLRFVKSVPAHDVVVMTDSDAFWNGGHMTAEELLNRWDQARDGKPIVAMAEKHCWVGRPCERDDLAAYYPEVAEHAVRPPSFLNAGAVAGRAGAVAHALEWMKESHDAEQAEASRRGFSVAFDDQRLMAKFRASNPGDIALDTHGLFFGLFPDWPHISCAGDACTGANEQGGSTTLTIDGASCAVVVEDASSGRHPSPLVWHAPGQGPKRVVAQVIAQIHNCLRPVWTTPGGRPADAARAFSAAAPSRVIYINTDGSPARNAHMQRSLFGYPGRVERVRAVPGDEALAMLRSPELSNPKGLHAAIQRKPATERANTVGCWASHVGVLQRLAQELGPSETALILEDDVDLPPPKELVAGIEQSLRSAPADWDVLKVCGFGERREADRVDGTWFSVRGPFVASGQIFYGGSAGYLVSGASAGRVVEHVRDQPIRDFDASLFGDHSTLQINTYMLSDPMFGLHWSFPSTIHGTQAGVGCTHYLCASTTMPFDLDWLHCARHCVYSSTLAPHGPASMTMPFAPISTTAMPSASHYGHDHPHYGHYWHGEHYGHYWHGEPDYTGRGAYAPGMQHRWITIDPTRDVFAQAYSQLYDAATKRMFAHFSVRYVHHGKQDDGHDAQGLRKDFVSSFAASLKTSGLLADAYQDRIWRLSPVRFFDPESTRFPRPVDVRRDDPDKWRFFGAALAQLFRLDSTASSNFLPFTLDSHIYDALAAGEVRRPPAAGGPDELGECGAVEALLDNAGMDASSLWRLGPYGRRPSGADGRVWAHTEDYELAGVEWGDLAPEGVQPSAPVAFERAREALLAACERFWRDGWETPMTLVLEGWTAQHGPHNSAPVLDGAARGQFAAALRQEVERLDPVDIASLRARMRGASETYLDEVGAALAIVRDGDDGGEMKRLAEFYRAAWDGGDDRLGRVLRFWSGSPHVDATRWYEVMPVAADVCVHQVKSHACGNQLDVPRACFEENGGSPVELATALFVAATLNGDAYGLV